jgi:hypothetical protein
MTGRSRRPAPGAVPLLTSPALTHTTRLARPRTAATKPPGAPSPTPAVPALYLYHFKIRYIPFSHPHRARQCDPPSSPRDPRRRRQGQGWGGHHLSCCSHSPPPPPNHKRCCYYRRDRRSRNSAAGSLALASRARGRFTYLTDKLQWPTTAGLLLPLQVSIYTVHLLRLSFSLPALHSPLVSSRLVPPFLPR